MTQIKLMTIRWEVETSETLKQVKVKSNRTPVMEMVDNLVHAVCVNYSELKIPGCGMMKDYFIIVLHPCCFDQLNELKAKGFRNSKTYPGFVLEYTMTEDEVLWFKNNQREFYTLAQNYPGKIYETKSESFREIYEVNIRLIADWRKREALRIEEMVKSESRSVFQRKYLGNGDN